MQRTCALTQRPVVRDFADGPWANGVGVLRHPASAGYVTHVTCVYPLVAALFSSDPRAQNLTSATYLSRKTLYDEGLSQMDLR